MSWILHNLDESQTLSPENDKEMYDETDRLLWQTLIALVDATRSNRGHLPLGIVMTMVLLSFGENIEIEAYMLWPGLMILGIHASEVASDRQA